MSKTRSFQKEVLQRLADDWAPDGFEIVQNKLIDTSRWDVQYELIFKFEDSYYMTSYSRGATELQDTSPFEYDDNFIDCYEVEPYTRTVVDYRKI